MSVTLTDERWVSPQDPASNEWLLRDLLLRRRAAAATFYGFKTNHAKATGGAATAEKRIAPIMPFDICLHRHGTGRAHRLADTRRRRL